MLNDLIASKTQIIESLVVVIVYVVLKYVTNKIIGSAGRKFDYPKARVTMINKITNTTFFFALLGFMLFIWGVDQGQLVYFVTSLLALVGIAFFAQWSIISNITSTLIIYFNHPVRIGDSITVLDKDYNVEGKILDIGIFFMTIKTKEGAEITLPSNVFMQKMIQRKTNSAASKAKKAVES